MGGLLATVLATATEPSAARDAGGIGQQYYFSNDPGPNTYFRYDANGNLADIVKADLSTRVVRLPRSPSTCYGAEDGDLLSIRYAAAFEVPQANRSEVDEASLDLLTNPDAGEARWTVYDTSEKRGGIFRLPLGDRNVIAGVDIALHGMCEGEQRVLYIPAGLGYGSVGNKDFGVPPRSLLRHDVELVSLLPMGRAVGRSRGGRREKPTGTRKVQGRVLE